MIKSRIAVAGALLAVAGAANAGLSVTPTITSDYDFRGYSQTSPDQDGVDPAFQLGATYTFDSGFYLGTWGSNIDFGTSKPDVEIDYFAGYAGEAAGLKYDVGVNYYSYPSEGGLNSYEIYTGISKGWFSAKLWFSPNTVSSGEDGTYLEGNATFPLPYDISLSAHVGHTFGSGTLSYTKATDYSVGLSKTFSNFTLGVKYVDGAESVIDGRAIVSVSTTLPWAK